ncbi:prepilin-type N-terminal cleavage/methylation domain-containing protein [Deinococcus sp. MIMF12]|uniref:Prepilin-type N-terminal cleavage/methylation domain-containing protein n=1 Tax=Deinococcus rhizophilus TaxID=3049544 RepID=A0ABT7JG56_9DEIO|nr:prepilin-type N-terminal cleavage/methylation domain-containing protein [Deinococcus rhizophilus]MDL2344038.1 prepilin-type N-terminal cleavage/methylation domain-containing protein [Deinococcus rhizophilus]
MKGRAEEGLTLIEVLVALSIFAIVSVAVLSMFPAIFKLNSQTRADQAVTIGAKQYLESVRLEFATAADFDAATTSSLAAGPSGASVNNYECAPAVTNTATDSSSTVIIKRVTLTCTHDTEKDQTFVLDFGRPSS